MKPTPLKGKMSLHCGDPKLDQHYEFFKKEHVRDAVEWLLIAAKTNCNPDSWPIFEAVIKDAFEDVIVK